MIDSRTYRIGRRIVLVSRNIKFSNLRSIYNCTVPEGITTRNLEDLDAVPKLVEFELGIRIRTSK